MAIKFDKRTPVPFDPLTDPDVLATLQLYFVAFVELKLKQQNGNAVNICRAFRDHVAETCAQLKQ